MLHKLFLDHPRSVGETYAEHCAAALGFAVRMIAGGVACLVHAFLPFLFERTASTVVVALHERLVHRWRGHAASTRPEIDYAI